MSPEEPAGSGSGPIARADAVRLPPRRQTPHRWLFEQLMRIEARSRARGSRATRLAGWIVWALVAAIGLLLLIGPVINEPLGFDDRIEAAGSAGESWIARSFQAYYEVERKESGRLTVDVQERISAFFPEGVDESRIERVVSSQYQGHDVRPQLLSAELDGDDVSPEVLKGATRTAFRIDAGERLVGEHEVVLRYRLHDIAFDDFDDSTRAWTQTLEWEAFGPRWEHGSASTKVRITMPRELVDAYARDPRAGIGPPPTSASEDLERDHQTVHTVSYEFADDRDLPPHATAWFRFHLEPGTIAMPPPSLTYCVMVMGLFVPLLGAGVLLLVSLAARTAAGGDAGGRAAGRRRAPAGFVRDNVVAGALSLPVLQLGIVRQLSHQLPLTVFWWPIAVVALTLLLAVSVLALVATRRRTAVAGAHGGVPR